MRKSSPPLLAIFRTQLQGELLALVYLRPWDAAVSISDVARELGAPISTVHREVSRLVDAGLLDESKSGRTRLVRSPDNDLVTRPLTELLAVTFGPLPVLTELLTGVAGVAEAYIYGSWAARYLGEPGPTPVDVDVLVIGDVDVDELDEIAYQASGRLRREVNIRRVRPTRWKHPGNDPFLASVKARPLVGVVPTAKQETGH